MLGCVGIGAVDAVHALDRVCARMARSSVDPSYPLRSVLLDAGLPQGTESSEADLIGTHTDDNDSES